MTTTDAVTISALYRIADDHVNDQGRYDTRQRWMTYPIPPSGATVAQFEIVDLKTPLAWSRNRADNTSFANDSSYDAISELLFNEPSRIEEQPHASSILKYVKASIGVSQEILHLPETAEGVYLSPLMQADQNGKSMYLSAYRGDKAIYNVDAATHIPYRQSNDAYMVEDFIPLAVSCIVNQLPSEHRISIESIKFGEVSRLVSCNDERLVGGFKSFFSGSADSKNSLKNTKGVSDELDVLTGEYLAVATVLLNSWLYGSNLLGYVSARAMQEHENYITNYKFENYSYSKDIEPDDLVTLSNGLPNALAIKPDEKSTMQLYRADQVVAVTSTETRIHPSIYSRVFPNNMKEISDKYAVTDPADGASIRGERIRITMNKLTELRESMIKIVKKLMVTSGNAITADTLKTMVNGKFSKQLADRLHATFRMFSSVPSLAFVMYMEDVLGSDTAWNLMDKLGQAAQSEADRALFTLQADEMAKLTNVGTLAEIQRVCAHEHYIHQPLMVYYLIQIVPRKLMKEAGAANTSMMSLAGLGSMTNSGPFVKAAEYFREFRDGTNIKDIINPPAAAPAIQEDKNTRLTAAFDDLPELEFASTTEVKRKSRSAHLHDPPETSPRFIQDTRNAALARDQAAKNHKPSFKENLMRMVADHDGADASCKSKSDHMRQCGLKMADRIQSDMGDNRLVGEGLNNDFNYGSASHLVNHVNYGLPLLLYLSNTLLDAPVDDTSANGDFIGQRAALAMEYLEHLIEMIPDTPIRDPVDGITSVTVDDVILHVTLIGRHLHEITQGLWRHIGKSDGTYMTTARTLIGAYADIIHLARNNLGMVISPSTMLMYSMLTSVPDNHASDIVFKYRGDGIGCVLALTMMLIESKAVPYAVRIEMLRYNGLMENEVLCLIAMDMKKVDQLIVECNTASYINLTSFVGYSAMAELACELPRYTNPSSAEFQAMTRTVLKFRAKASGQQMEKFVNGMKHLAGIDGTDALLHRSKGINAMLKELHL